ncbi:ThiF family adenylyltransferase [Planotetraspora kaengkrachanensis]|nr:ThiF family adenylyltransferase [Planotetraspora kaengkrachanensis]
MDESGDETFGDHVWRPRLFDAGRDAGAVRRLMDDGVAWRVHDTIDGQLRQLVRSREPAMAADDPLVDRRVEEVLEGRDPFAYGTWVWFPWSARLVHLLPRPEFHELRTDRNRYKITSREQEVLAGKRVGVVGLSVGNAAAVTMAQEGVGGSFRLADFDRIELSNLNRLRAGVHDLGIDKTVLAARQMAEINPYLDISTFPRGLGEEDFDDFLLSGGPLDLVVEECDDLYVKIAIRERARHHGIPVVMDTNDRGMLDIERFDLEPGRPILHGLLGEARAEDLRDLSTAGKVPFVLALLDERRISRRLAASLPEIARTVSSWPQLASGAALGGAIATDAARRILLGEKAPSGRYYADPFEPASEQAFEPASEQAFEPASEQAFEPASGQAFEPAEEAALTGEPNREVGEM